MADNTVTLVLEGDVPLIDFAQAIAGFNELVAALSEDTGSPSLIWLMDDLQISSTVATARSNGNAREVASVVHAYAEVGVAYQTGQPIRYSEKAKRATEKIVSITSVNRVRFETATQDILIPTERTLALPLPVRPLLKISTFSPAFGAIEGRVQTLSNRNGLRFTLYDVLYDKAISCYLQEGKEDAIRNLWGKLAVIEGIVTRDPATGRPLSIRQIADVTPLPEPYSTALYREAAGCVSPNDLLPEDVIRRVRDAN
jgi:hypothetical protein